jgi:hypothetical protein
MNTWRRRLIPCPLPRMGWRGDRVMRGERKEVGWRMRSQQLRRRPSLPCGGIDGQIGVSGGLARGTTHLIVSGPARHQHYAVLGQ